MTENKDKEWKKILAEFLKKLKVIRDDFTGKVEIDLNQGGIGSISRTEKL